MLFVVGAMCSPLYCLTQPFLLSHYCFSYATCVFLVTLLIGLPIYYPGVCSPVLALTSLLSCKSEARQGLVFEVSLNLFRIRQVRIEVNFVWVPAHVGVDGNEEVDLLAKKALNHTQIEIKLALSKAEFKRVISVEVNKKWQKLWNSESKGRHLFQIKEYVGKERKRYGNRKKDVIISRLRIGHTALNHSLYKIGKHESGKCDKCGPLETVMHIIFECSAYERERVQLMLEL